MVVSEPAPCYDAGVRAHGLIPRAKGDSMSDDKEKDLKEEELDNVSGGTGTPIKPPGGGPRELNPQPLPPER